MLPYTDRLNYVSPLLNNVGYIMAVEKLIGIKPTERAEYIRVLAGEISRICDHLTCVRRHGLELGASPPSSTPSRRASCCGTASPSCAGRA